jgi:uncharacterized coiled-coil protein SlyX
MKNVMIIFATVLLIVASGCKEKEKKEIARLNRENQLLRVESQAKDSSINNILTSLNEIESNLAVIREKEAGISIKTTGNEELAPETKDRINEDIKLISDLIAKNRKQIAWLQSQMKNSNLKIGEFEKMVEQLNAQMTEKDNQIASLNDELTRRDLNIVQLNASLDTLRTDKSNLTAKVEDQTHSLNTGYYITGTKKELLASNIIKKEGGFIGINRATKVKDFDESKFQKIDIRSFETIDVPSKKVQLVTNHPSNSYKMETNKDGKVEKIEITNPDKFWSRSKYLIVMIN